MDVIRVFVLGGIALTFSMHCSVGQADQRIALDQLLESVAENERLLDSARIVWRVDESIQMGGKMVTSRLTETQLRDQGRSRRQTTGLPNVDLPSDTIDSIAVGNGQFNCDLLQGALGVTPTASILPAQASSNTFLMRCYPSSSSSPSMSAFLKSLRDTLVLEYESLGDGRFWVKRLEGGNDLVGNYVMEFDSKYPSQPCLIEHWYLQADARASQTATIRTSTEIRGYFVSKDAVVPGVLKRRVVREVDGRPPELLWSTLLEVSSFEQAPTVSEQDFLVRLPVGTVVHDAVERLEYVVGEGGTREYVKPLVTTVPGSGSTTQDWIDWLLHPAVYGTVGVLCLLIYGIARWRFA